MNRLSSIFGLALLVAISGVAVGCGDDDDPPGPTDAGPRDSGSGDSGSMTGDAGDAGGAAPTCAEYCTSITAACTGANQQYADMAACMTYCNGVGWAAGTGGATMGNTLACRIYHAGAASDSMPDVHCPHAGPLGGDVCGTACENYCRNTTAHCSGANQIWANEAACMTACAMFPTTGAVTDTGGDTVWCRAYHASTPAAGAPNDHCPHADVDGTEVCVADVMGFNFRTELPSSYTRVDRMGMPAVATALVGATPDEAMPTPPLAERKNSYNDGNPSDDAMLTFAGELLRNLGNLHAALDDDLAGLGLTPCSMSVPEGGTLPECVAQTVGAGGPAVVSLIVPDTLKLNPAAASTFPNGRALADPVIDITLSVALLRISMHGPGTLAGVPVNPAANDVDFLETFPYLADPHPVPTL